MLQPLTMKLAKFSKLISFAITLTVFAHIPSSTQKVVSIRKCCAEDEVIDVTVMKCRNSGGTKWTPSYFADSENEHEDQEAYEGISKYEIKSEIPACPGTGVHIIPLRDLDAHEISAAKFRLLANGKIVAKHSNGHWVTVPQKSCVDGLQNFDSSGSLYSGHELDQALITCPLLEEDISF